MTAVKGRKISDEKALMVRALRRRGLSIRKIAERVKVSRSSVHRLTRGISWEEPPVRPLDLEIKRPVQPRETEQFVRSKQSPVLPEQAGRKEQQVCLRVQDKEESELDQAEAYVRRMPFASKLYEHIDFQNRLDSLRSDDPLEEYKKRRKKSLSGIAILNGFWNKRRSS